MLDEPCSTELRERLQRVFAQEFGRLRKAVGSQAQFAALMHSNQAYVSRWELGESVPNLAHLTEIIKALKGIGLLTQPQEAYRLVWLLRCEEWFSLFKIRALLQQVFGLLPPDGDLLPFLQTQPTPVFEPQYVPRLGLLEAVKEHLFRAPGRPGVVGLWGPGGSGKTTLLAALGYEPEIWEQFDAVLWLELGERASLDTLTDRLGSWARVLSKSLPALLTLDGVTHAVHDGLRLKRPLLLLDDVWDSECVRRILEAVPHAKVVVTTRSVEVVDRLNAGAAVIPVPAMTLDEATSLVAGVTQQPAMVRPGRSQMAELYGLVMGMPLALYLAACSIRDVGWDSVIRLGRHPERLRLLQRDRHLSRQDSVRVSLMHSYDDLAHLDGAQRQAHFRALGALADAPFFAETFGAACGLPDVAAAEEELLRLFRCGMMSRVGALAGRPLFRVHPLLHELARGLLRERKEEMQETSNRFVAHQIEIAELLSRRLNAPGEPLGRVLQEFAAELPQIDRAYRHAIDQGNTQAVTRLLDACFGYLSTRGHTSLVEEWLNNLDDWLEANAEQADMLGGVSARYHYYYGQFLCSERWFDLSAIHLGSALVLGLGDAILETSVRAMLAFVWFQMGNDEKAQYYLERAEQRQAELQHPLVAGYLAHLRAEMAHIAGQPKEVIWDWHLKAVEAFASLHDRAYELGERARLMQSYVDHNETERGLAEARLLVVPARQHGLFALSYHCLDLILRAAFFERDTQAAVEWLPHFEEVAGQLGIPGCEGQIWQFRAMLAGLHGDWEQALACLDQSSQKWLASGDMTGWEWNQLTALQLYTELGRMQEAADTVERIRQQTDEIPRGVARHPALTIYRDAGQTGVPAG